MFLLTVLGGFSQQCPLQAVASLRENTRWHHCDHPNSFATQNPLITRIFSFREGEQTTDYVDTVPRRTTTSVR